MCLIEILKFCHRLVFDFVVSKVLLVVSMAWKLGYLPVEATMQKQLVHLGCTSLFTGESESVGMTDSTKKNLAKFVAALVLWRTSLE